MVAFLNQLPWRFLILYGALYAGFGVQSPYLPSLLETRNLTLEAIATVLAAGTAIRTTTPTSRPEVSVTTWRLRPLTFLAAS
jgi:hypothetical protein